MDTLLQQSKDLQNKLRAISPLAGSRLGDDLSDRLEFLRRLFDAKIVHEIEGSFEGPLVIVIAGGTNVGKSEVFNALCGREVSLPDPRAGRTRRPAVFADRSATEAIADPNFLKGYDRMELIEPEDLHQATTGRPCFHYSLRKAPDKKGLIFIDSPDIDSNRLDNLASATHLLAASDVIVFVTSPSKYNDEACVSFLDKTLDIGREIFVVFNLLGPEAKTVVADFRSAVLNRHEKAHELNIAEVPRFPAGDDVFRHMITHTEVLAQQISSLPKTDTKRHQARTTLAYIQKEFSSVVERIHKDIERVAKLAKDTQDNITAVRGDYRRALFQEPFYEIEAVFQEVLDQFSVPIVDDVLKAPGKVVKWVVRRIQGRDSERSEINEKVRRRKDRDRKKVAEMADALRSRAMKALADTSSDPLIAEVLRKANEGTLGRPAEQKAELIWDEMEPAFTRWKEEMRDEIIEKLRASPNLRAVIRTSKAVLQVGSGILVAVLVGGFGPGDLVIAPVTAKFTQYILETFGSAYFSAKRDDYLELHLKRFDAVTTKIILGPLDEALPKRPDSREIEDTKKALSNLRIQTP